MANCRWQLPFVREIARENPHLFLRISRHSSHQFLVFSLLLSHHHHFIRLVYFCVAKPLSRQGNVERKNNNNCSNNLGWQKKSWANTLGVKWIDDYINLCVCVSDRVHFVLTNMDSLSSNKRKGEKVCVHITQQQSHHGKRRVREEKSI